MEAPGRSDLLWKDPVGDTDQLLQATLAAYWKVFHILYLPALVAWCRLGLSLQQLQVLLQVTSADTVYISTLATELGISRPAASILVQGLTERGLLTRTEDPVDRRRTIVQLTVDDTNVFGDALQQQGGEVQSNFASLAPSKMLALLQELKTIEEVMTR